MEAHPSAAAADVESPAADEAHGSPIQWVPASKRRQIQPRIAGRLDEAVVALDDLERIATIEGG
jgi:hypothetical protein